MNIKKKVEIVCPCNKIFLVPPCHAKGRKKYCSKKCMYEFRTRPSGMVYKIVETNAGWFGKGERHLYQLHKTDMNEYKRIHVWANKNYKKIGSCKKCGKDCGTQLANISREYNKNISDWTELCSSCHRYYDYHRKDSSWLA